MSWHYFSSKAEADRFAANDDWNDVRKVRFTNPGWYFVENTSQPCPKGCCTDRVLLIRPADVVAGERRQKMLDLQAEWHEAADKAAETAPPDHVDRATRPADWQDGFLTESVRGLLEAMTADPDFIRHDLAPILADALEEAEYAGGWLGVLRADDLRLVAGDWILTLVSGAGEP